ncbi:tripartite ATP-independent transporter DctM subunit [Neobacillus niacini]|uniref:TRAP transporter large permease n=1 Tax=Neobacillus niacini TaxID=86668 RepID=UPI00285E0395|nr:TRAP transporter large permease [Neobacillus niacini]MDR7076133.1 tripartite ATP-independent transporter DctM subunit [Neobacillus niacini]
MLTLGICILLLLLLFIGMPIGFTLIAVGSLGIFMVGGIDSFTGILSTTAYRSVNSFTLTTIPLFILMANFISKSNIAKDLYDSILKWIGHVPGGVGVSTVFASAGFGTLSGSSIAATSIMAKICVPEMIKARYKDSFAAGLVASSTGTLAVMIPPSVPLILYAIQTETSIGKLLMAGIIPGILLAFLLCLYIVFASIKLGSKTEKVSWRERFISLKYIWPMILLVLLVISIMYFGIATATEASAFGAIGALVIGAIMKRLNLKDIIEALKDASQQTAMIFTIIIGGYIFAYFFTLTGLGQSLISAIAESGLSKWTVLFLVIIFYLILGLVMDLIGSMILTLPLIFPVMVNLGFDPIWFGVIVVLLLEIGLVTPPVGINLYITSQQTGVPDNKVWRGSIPFLGILLFTIVLMCIFPQIILYLPNQM